jgi:methionyl-tRNA formyltransferase
VTTTSPTATTAEPATRAASERLRIVFVTPDEPLVTPIFFEQVIPRVAEEIVAIAIVRPIYRGSSSLKQARKFIAAFGLRDFAIELAHYAVGKSRNALGPLVPVARQRSVRRFARRHGIPLVRPDDVNAPAFLQLLAGLEPDLVISVSSPQIFGEELLRLPRLGCINLHSALLPRFRGVLPTFWALSHGETETGATIHYMSPGIDGGAIIAQRVVGIGADETVHSLMKKCKLVGAQLMLETLAGFRAGSVTARPNPTAEGSYFSFPTREDVARFRVLGRRLR